ncbi:MAG TPA: hypothetical protein VEN79_04550 [Terriglobia bacterium]|nr:hypothetical protein [Terriglobia bacterium]
MSDLPAFAPGAEACRSWIATSAEKLSQTMCSESFLGYRRSGFALLAIFILLEIILGMAGAPPVAGPWDTAALLDAGWRIVNGQVPHTDFHNPIGPLAYLLVAFGMKIAAPSTASITYGNVLLLAFLLPLAWYIASERLSWAVASILVLFAGFFLISPRPPGYGIRGTTYAMIYNRQGYVLISLLLLCLFLKPRGSAKRSASLEGLFVGVLLALLLYCKITYFLAAAALTLLAVIIDVRPRRWFIVSAGAFVGVCAAFFVLFHINLHSYLLDVVAAGPVQSSAMRIKLLSGSLVGHATWIYMLILWLGLWTWAQGPGRPRFSTLGSWFVAGSILAAALLISSGNAAQDGGADDPLYFVAAVVLLELFRRQNADHILQSGTVARFAYTASLVLMLPIFCGTILARDLASCAYVVAWDVERRPVFDASRRLHSVRLRDFYVPASTEHSTAYWLASDHPAKINDGIDLLRRYLQKGDRVTTIAFTNPFSFALGLTPARDGFLWWDLNFSFDRLHFPPAEDFLGDASLVMVPRLADRSRGCCFETADVLLGLYGDYLRAHFHKLDSTNTWVLYRRNPGLVRSLTDANSAVIHKIAMASSRQFTRLIPAPSQRQSTLYRPPHEQWPDAGFNGTSHGEARFDFWPI